MRRNALVTDLRSEQWPTGEPAPDDKLRLTKIEADLLDEARKASHTKGQQFRIGALQIALIADILSEDFDRCHARLGRLTGRSIPNGVCLRCGGQAVVEGTPSGKSLPVRESARSAASGASAR